MSDDKRLFVVLLHGRDSVKIGFMTLSYARAKKSKKIWLDNGVYAKIISWPAGDSPTVDEERAVEIEWIENNRRHPPNPPHLGKWPKGPVYLTFAQIKQVGAKS